MNEQQPLVLSYLDVAWIIHRNSFSRSNRHLLSKRHAKVMRGSYSQLYAKRCSCVEKTAAAKGLHTILDAFLIMIPKPIEANESSGLRKSSYATKVILFHRVQKQGFLNRQCSFLSRISIHPITLIS